MRPRLLCLAILPLLLSAATPIQTAAPPPVATDVVRAVPIAPVLDLAAVKVAPEVTAKWDALLASGTAGWTVCLRVALEADTLKVTEDPAPTCSLGSARYSSRPLCVANESDAADFAATNERLRFIVCAPHRAFLLVRPSRSVPAPVPIRRVVT